MNRIIFTGKSPLFRLVALILIVIICIIAIGFGGFLSGYLFFGERMNIVLHQNATLSPGDIQVLKYFQLVSHMSMFFIPAFLFTLLFYRRPVSVVRASSFPGFRQIMLGLLIILLIQPLVTIVSEWNSSIYFPESMQNLEESIRKTEREISRLTSAFLQTKSITGFFYNILLIAVIPAIGEEWMFRGVLQHELKRWFKNVHVAVWVTGVLFSLVHFQFYGFFPRIILGVLLGYLFVYSGNLWVPIAAHFLNNAVSIGAVFFFDVDLTSTDQQFSDNIIVNLSIAALSVLFTVWGFKYLIKEKLKGKVLKKQLL